MLIRRWMHRIECVKHSDTDPFDQIVEAAIPQVFPLLSYHACYFLIIDKARTGDLINGLASLRLSRYSIATAGPFHSLSSSQPLLGYY